MRIDNFGIFIVINPLELVFFVGLVGLVGLCWAVLVLGVVGPGRYIQFVDVFRGVKGRGAIDEVADLSLFAVVEDALYPLLRGVSVELAVVLDVEAVDHFDGRDDFVGTIHFCIEAQM